MIFFNFYYYNKIYSLIKFFFMILFSNFSIEHFKICAA
jgi:hypothetical protein